MESGIKGCVERNIVVGHDTTAAIDGTMLTERLELQRVGKVDTVGICQFTALQTVHHIHRIVLAFTLRIGLLYATA